jgi:hypothetical protein
MPRLSLPPWIRRAVEAALVAAAVAIASLVGTGLTAGGEPYALPAGAAGTLFLAPSTLALGVVTAAYPVVMAATREDAIFGAVGAFLVAADLVVVLAGERVLLERTQTTISGGLLASILALAPALIGLVASQVVTPLGFGRRAGAIAAVVSAVSAVIVLGVAAVIA